MSGIASLLRRAGLSAALVVLGLAGCTYRCPPPCPLEPEAVYAQVARERNHASRGEQIDLAEATARMRRGNPALRRARADWRTAARIAAVKTPHANPTLEAGPLILGGSDILESTALGAIAAFGWAVPLSPKRSLQDSLNAVKADAALVNVVGVERETYLLLRHDHAVAILGEDLMEAQEELLAAADEAQDSMTQAVDAGAATVLDARILALETARTRTDSLEVVVAVQDTRARWRSRLGAELDAEIRPVRADLPPWPGEIPSEDALERLVLEHHPDLARLRAEHRVAEKALRLEAARAIPDLEIGGFFEYERVDSKIGLPLGIEIPIADRNQPGIAAALGARSAIHDRYRARLQELLGEVEQDRRRLVTTIEKHGLLRQQLVEAQKMREAADETLQLSGALDMTRYLEILRTLRRVKLEELQGRVDVYEGWFQLESATGTPLLRFPNEPRAEGAAR